MSRRVKQPSGSIIDRFIDNYPSVVNGVVVVGVCFSFFLFVYRWSITKDGYLF